MRDRAGCAVAHAHREHWARVLAATVRVTRDIDLAEECAQDAYARAVEAWRRTGPPERPGSWLVTVARNRALDLLRRESLWRRALPLLVVDDVPAEEPDAVPDDRLRLVFTCCHPALDRRTQVELTLRLVCGLSTAEVARVLLVRETAMTARITRAKKKIAAARIPYRVPAAEDLPARLDAVCEVVHLVFTAGHTAPAGDGLIRADLVDRAVGLARMLRELLPGPQVDALLALLLLTDARRAGRVRDGRFVPLAEQDRSGWDRAAIAEGVDLLTAALRGHPPSRYAVQAAIAAVHAESPSWADTDWEEIVALYDLLRRLWPGPVVDLNRAVALGMRDGPEAGLAALEPLLDEPCLAGYGYLAAARADLLRRSGRTAEALTCYEEALPLTANAAERDHLTSLIARLRAGP
ncbi:sigma-70 family RNA polymerase sigma factor [Longispora sp. K20-0274]|uniref:RNA polymerase sigma factor n=1 Tax=Longispora sp. K20-0274 TaxID=3088255 RepID=UPI00399AD838